MLNVSDTEAEEAEHGECLRSQPVTVQSSTLCLRGKGDASGTVGDLGGTGAAGENTAVELVCPLPGPPLR